MRSKTVSARTARPLEMWRTRSLWRLSLLIAFLGLIGIGTPGLAEAAGSPRSRSVINTVPAWDGRWNACPFGYPAVASWGQLFIAPSDARALKSFSLFVFGDDGSVDDSVRGGTLTFRGELYAWNGAGASGPNLWESRRRSVELAAGANEVTFRTNNARVVAGQAYVFFVSISKDYMADQGDSCVGWVLGKDPYPDGRAVFLNNGDDVSAWTTEPWESLSDREDLAFKADFLSPGRRT